MTWKCVACLQSRSESECMCDSSIFGTNDMHILCEGCSDTEENFINLKGTNDITVLRDLYEENRKILRQYRRVFDWS